MNKTLKSLLVVALASATFPAFSAGQAGAAVQTPVATVNGVVIPGIYAQVVREDLEHSGRPVLTKPVEAADLVDAVRRAAQGT